MPPPKFTPCRFFVQGWCKNGDSCNFMHPSSTVTPNQAEATASADTISSLRYRSQNLSDSRANIMCKFVSRPGGCRNEHCSYSHNIDRVMGTQVCKVEAREQEQEQEQGDDLTRFFLGAWVRYSELGQVLKVTFPTDFSMACIMGFGPETTRQAVVEFLHGLGFNLNVDCVRISRHSASLETMATVKVENPSFAKDLGDIIKNQKSAHRVVPMNIDSSQVNCRKVNVSWHKATRSAWVNFGNGDIANRVSQMFNDGKYQCLGQSLKSSIAKNSSRRGGYFSYNRVAWTIVLSDVPSHASAEDVEEAIFLAHDKPRHIEMGVVSYEASDAEVSVEVRSYLEEYGVLESFYFPPSSQGRRVKAIAWFRDEADARSACSLDNRVLKILGEGKLTVSIVQSAKVKMPTALYFASKDRIDKQNLIWRRIFLSLRVYNDASQRFTTLKIEGTNTKAVAEARKILDEISNGTILRDNDELVWNSTLSTNGSTYERLKLIEKELGVIVIRNKSKRQLQFYGASEKLQPTVIQITNMLRKEHLRSYDIDLTPNQFIWMIRGGFKSVEQVLGKNVAVFNVVSRKVIVNGTQQQLETVLAIVEGRHVEDTSSIRTDSSAPETDCPICFCEADMPIQASCKHTYCFQCFEDYCKSARSTSKINFEIRCQGDEGNCPLVFTLREIRDHLSSSTVDAVLQSSFEEYIQRHPETFCYCPTPACGYVYRHGSIPDSRPLAYTCPNCFESICTSCDARHGDYTCAEYKDIASGGYEALEKLKKELNIKDCPKCTTLMEKTEGCNHMTCASCRAHICWVCMSVFERADACYSHMSKEHGGIGLGPEVERFQA